jgi:malonate-semialdehyde dehydrogenase (acetylating)/methylmalonate-semialdehyde dehydrogenase
MPDADPALTGKGVADSFTGCAGQRCMAASVLCAIAGNEAETVSINRLIGAVVESAQSISLGDRMGAIISRESLERLEKAIAKAESEGAKVILDGRKAQAPKVYGANGFWLGPTILDHVRPGTEAAVEELFGPVLSIVRCQSLGEALGVQAKSKYGNAVSVFTQNGGVADEVARQGRAGMVGVNVGVPVPREPFSFGGVLDSKYGHGDITGIHSLDFWSNMKKITTKWAVQKDWSWMG